MARTKGARNKNTILKQKKNIFKRIFSKDKFFLTDEDEFIKDATDQYLKWKSRGQKEYAEIFKMIINKYTK